MQKQILKAPTTTPIAQDRAQVREVVSRVIDDVRERGDDAVREYSQRFDSWSPPSFRLSEEDVDRKLLRAQLIEVGSDGSY